MQSPHQKSHQENERVPSTALTAQGTLEKTTLNLARRVSRLELHGHAVADAARLELKECEMTSHHTAIRIKSSI